MANMTQEEWDKRYFPNGRIHFPRESDDVSDVVPMDQQPPKKRKGDFEFSSSTSFVIIDSNFSEYLANMPTPAPLPPPQRRSPRMSKLNGRYGVALSPLPTLPPELMRYLFPPKGTITEAERQEAIEKFNKLPVASSPYDGFGFTDAEIAALENKKKALFNK